MTSAAASPTLSAWDLFVLRHREPGNLGVHFVAFIIYYGSPILALLLWQPLWLIGLPLSGMIGAAGHKIFNDGGVSVREATFSPQVVFFVTIMFYKISRGTYVTDIAAALRKAQLLGLNVSR